MGSHLFMLDSRHVLCPKVLGSDKSSQNACRIQVLLHCIC